MYGHRPLRPLDLLAFSRQFIEPYAVLFKGRIHGRLLKDFPRKSGQHREEGGFIGRRGFRQDIAGDIQRIGGQT